MKVIVKDYIIETSTIKEISIWGSEWIRNYNVSCGEEIAVFIEHYNDRLITNGNDLIVLGFVGEDIEENKRLLNEADRIVQFLESHITKLDYPTFE